MKTNQTLQVVRNTRTVVRHELHPVGFAGESLIRTGQLARFRSETKFIIIGVTLSGWDVPTRGALFRWSIDAGSTESRLMKQKSLDAGN